MCSHESVIYDHHSADEICEGCGFVMNERNFGESSADLLRDAESSDWAYKMKIREQILNVCAHLQSESNVVVEETLRLYLEMLDFNEKDRSARKRLSFRRGSIDRPALAFALMEAFARQKTFLQMEVIADIFEVTPQKIIRAGKYLPSCTTSVRPSMFGVMISERLGLSFRMSKLVEELLEHIEEDRYGHNTMNLVSAVICSITDELGERSPVKISSEDMRNYFGLRTVYGIRKQMRKLPRFEIIGENEKDFRLELIL